MGTAQIAVPFPTIRIRARSGHLANRDGRVGGRMRPGRRSKRGQVILFRMFSDYTKQKGKS